MKTVLTNPILVPIELNLIEDIVRMIGQAVHQKFTFLEVSAVQQNLINKAQEALKEHQNKLHDQQKSNSEEKK